MCNDDLIVPQQMDDRTAWRILDPQQSKWMLAALALAL